MPTFIENIERLRDYLISHPNLKMGYEFNGQSVKALLSDLKTKGVPRSVAHDKIYDEALEMYQALKPRIDEAYDSSPLDDFGNPAFAKFGDNIATGIITGVDRDEDGNIVGFDPEKFLLGVGGLEVAKQAIKSPKVTGKLKAMLQTAIHHQYILGKETSKKVVNDK